MQLISEWVINIVMFILLAMIVDMLLPDTAIKKYVKLVVGLLLISIVVTPIFQFLSIDFDKAMDSFLTGQNNPDITSQKNAEEKKREIETSQHAYILEQMAVQLKEKAEKEMIENHGMIITDIDISSTSSPAQDPESILETIKKITVHIDQYTTKDRVAEVEQVSIQIKDQTGNDTAVQEEKIRLMLASEWDVPESKIELVAKGGTGSP
ncbi:MAG TPA: stage III sporulation protein AF [Bacillus bacterium]|uniref:Stage III sporulation protein AF n=1 Tax=Siminovitchia fordii TaxID=254759 RepID=A0ABQ4K2I7_9BACI|nr:stage III sporulation protein AF [Siminovitchia fordii]GIN19960.1 stage III sporulation protein AF [Siminovitchia fordii]HBZ08981.1 stage III sporulation protein AF [Bacillus sp. (in: firmicutes)]